MLAFLLDQYLSAEIAEQIRSKRPEIKTASLSEWRGGAFVGITDTLRIGFLPAPPISPR